MTSAKALSSNELFQEAFSKPRTPRSSEYKDGALSLLRKEIDGVAFSCPYAGGTPHADAFWSGVEEGWMILRTAQKSAGGD